MLSLSFIRLHEKWITKSIKHHTIKRYKDKMMKFWFLFLIRDRIWSLFPLPSPAPCIHWSCVLNLLHRLDVPFKSCPFAKIITIRFRKRKPTNSCSRSNVPLVVWILCRKSSELSRKPSPSCKWSWIINNILVNLSLLKMYDATSTYF